MEAAKAHLEAIGQVKVIGGYLSISSDSQLRRKLERKAGTPDLSPTQLLDFIPSKHRLEMASFFVEPSTWLQLSQFSSQTGRTAREFTEHTRTVVDSWLTQSFGSSGPAQNTTAQVGIRSTFRVKSVVGADTLVLMKSAQTFQDLVVVINRHALL